MNQNNSNDLYPSSLKMLGLSFIIIGLGVGFGAIGAHALKNEISPSAMLTFETGVRYHLLHAIGIAMISLLSLLLPEGFPLRRTLSLGSIFHLVGILLFSGNCYLYALSGIKIFALLVPMGGVLWIFSWIWMGWKTMRLEIDALYKKNSSIGLMLLLCLGLSSCSHRYENFSILDKRNLGKQFSTTSLSSQSATSTPQDSYDQTMAPFLNQEVRTPVLQPTRREKMRLGHCENQWLFFNNAHREAMKNFDQKLSYSCSSHGDFLLQAKVEETWWTVLFFSRACFEVNAYCSK